MSTPTPTRSAPHAESSPDETSSTRGWRRLAAGAQLQITVLFCFLVLLVVVFSLLTPDFPTGPNFLAIVANAGVIGIISLGQTVAMVAGGFDLSVGGTAPLGAVVFALAFNAGAGFGGALVLVLAIGAVAGIVNGVVIAGFRINPLIATLGTTAITGGLALTLAGGVDIPFVEPAAGVLADQAVAGIDNQVWVFLGLGVVTWFVLRRTVFGRYLYTLGGNREAARLSGIRVVAVQIWVYVCSGTLAALAGVILASQLLTGSGTVGTNSGLQSITAVILGGAALTGGVGGVPGTLLGVLILGTLANGMTVIGVPSFYQTIATGVVLLLAVGLSQLRRRPGRRRNLITTLSGKDTP